MEYIEISNKEVKNQTNKIIDLIRNSDNCYDDKEYKNKFGKKLKKTIKTLIKNSELLKTDDDNSFFVVEKNSDDKNIHNIWYWSNDYNRTNEELRNLISNKISTDGNFNAIIFINKLDTYTLNYFGVDKIMLFDGQIFYSTMTSENNEEWFIIPGFTNADLLSVNTSSTFNESINNEPTNIASEHSEENIMQQEDVYNDDQSENAYDEDYYENNTKQANNIVDNNEFLDNNVQENTIDKQKSNDKFNDKCNFEDDENDTNIVNEEKDWYKEFYDLRGDDSNNIKSTKERFDLNKIQKYEMIKNYYDKFDISDLNSLRKNSTVNFDNLNSNNSSYTKSKDIVEQQLEKLKKLNEKNKSLISRDLNEKKSTTDDLINKIKELKK